MCCTGTMAATAQNNATFSPLLQYRIRTGTLSAATCRRSFTSWTLSSTQRSMPSAAGQALWASLSARARVNRPRQCSRWECGFVRHVSRRCWILSLEPFSSSAGPCTPSFSPLLPQSYRWTAASYADSFTPAATIIGVTLHHVSGAATCAFDTKVHYLEFVRTLQVENVATYLWVHRFSFNFMAVCSAHCY